MECGKLLVAVYNFEVEDFHTYYVTDSAILVHNRCRGKNNIKPGPSATGDHTSFKYDKNGTIQHYITDKVNPQSPTGFEWVKKYDGVGRSHGGVPTPHVVTREGVRSPYDWEIPGVKTFE